MTPTCIRTALELVQRMEAAEQALVTLPGVTLAERLTLQARAKERTANALIVAASFAISERK